MAAVALDRKVYGWKGAPLSLRMRTRVMVRGLWRAQMANRERHPPGPPQPVRKRGEVTAWQYGNDLMDRECVCVVGGYPMTHVSNMIGCPSCDVHVLPVY